MTEKPSAWRQMQELALPIRWLLYGLFVGAIIGATVSVPIIQPVIGTGAVQGEEIELVFWAVAVFATSSVLGGGAGFLLGWGRWALTRREGASSDLGGDAF